MQDRALDIQQDMLQNSITDKQELDLTKGLQDLTLKEDKDTQNLTDALAPLPDISEKKDKDKVSKSSAKPPYEMTKQEIQLQEEEEKYGIYMGTFRYEADNSDLDSETDTKSNITAYPYLE